jgi:protein-S-isoprenylcysteine O-methyltransferase Ste14
MEVFLNFLRHIRKRSHFTSMDWFWVTILILVFMTSRPTHNTLILGFSFSLLGEWIRVWVGGYPLRQKEFYVAGPYRYVRHPRFLGSFLTFLGLILAGGNAYLLWGYIFVAMFLFPYFSREEEKTLLAIAGEKFLAYKHRVLAFIPQLFPYQTYNPKQHKFSFNYGFFSRKRREVDSTLGLIVAYLLLFGLMYVPQSEQWLIHLVLALLLAAFIGIRVVFYANFSKGVMK